MKMMTATELKTNPGAFFDHLLRDGGVTLTRNGRLFQLKLSKENAVSSEQQGASVDDSGGVSVVLDGISAELFEIAQQFAAAQGTNISELIAFHLRSLAEMHQRHVIMPDPRLEGTKLRGVKNPPDDAEVKRMLREDRYK